MSSNTCHSADGDQQNALQAVAQDTGSRHRQRIQDVLIDIVRYHTAPAGPPAVTLAKMSQSSLSALWTRTLRGFLRPNRYRRHHHQLAAITPTRLRSSVLRSRFLRPRRTAGSVTESLVQFCEAAFRGARQPMSRDAVNPSMGAYIRHPCLIYSVIGCRTPLALASSTKLVTLTELKRIYRLR